MSAPTPANEAQRLRALSEYHIMDSAPEEAFDDLAKLASLIFGCEIGLVTMIDEKRQWFKARVGLEVSETPREYAFCAHAILDPMNVLVVPDATRDPRFVDNPLVTENPHIRFYAGAPLLTQQGDALGTLCVIDRTPRQPTPMQLAALRILGRQVSYLLELRRVSRALSLALGQVSPPARP